MFLTALLFALVQGITEFLPVSSSGQLSLLALVLGDIRKPFLIISSLHAVTATAAVVYYRREYRQAVNGIWKPGGGRHFVWRYAGTQAITLAVTALWWVLMWLLWPTLADHLRYDWLLGGMMLANAAILFLAPRRDDVPSHGTLPALTWRTVAWVGLAQAISVLPGLSRSGLTVAAGLRAGLSPAQASAFCFLLAPPLMLAFALVFLVGTWSQASAWFSSWQSAATTLVVVLVTFLVALGSLHWTVSWVRAGRLWWFAPWSGLVGIVTLVTAIW